MLLCSHLLLLFPTALAFNHTHPAPSNNPLPPPPGPARPCPSLLCPGYDWAIISGGAPAFSGPNGCSMDPPPVEYYNPSSDGGGGGGGLFGWLASTLQRLQRKVARAVGAVRDARTGSSRGLWLFSRKPVDPEGTAQMERVAMELGFDISGLRTVEQEGCAYGDKELPPGTVVTPPDAAAKAAAAATPPPNTPNVSVAPAAAAAPKGDESRKLH